MGIPVYGIHSDHRSPTARSRYWKRNFFWDLSKAHPEESIEWFHRIARKIGTKPILISTDDMSCLFVEDNAEALRQEYLFPKQPTGLARTLANKKQLYFLCKEKSIITPETLFPQSRDDVIEFIKRAKFPVMLKGIDTVALQHRVGIRMVIAEEAGTLLNCYDRMESSSSPSLMLQEYIAGSAEDVWMFNGYFNDESDCLFGITGRKLRQYPAYTGMTSLGICERNETVLKLSKNFMKSIGYRGILDIGYKHNAHNGKYYLLDPNPRLGCSFRLFVDSIGMDVVRALYRDMTGQPVEVGDLKEGRKWLVEPFDIVSTIRYWRDGNMGFREWIRSFRGVEEAQWFARDDMLPFMTVWWGSFRQSLSRYRKKSKKGDTH